MGDALILARQFQNACANGSFHDEEPQSRAWNREGSEFVGYTLSPHIPVPNTFYCLCENSNFERGGFLKAGEDQSPKPLAQNYRGLGVDR